MAKFIKKSTYKKVEFGAENYNDLSSFTEVSAETGKKGVIAVIDTNGSKRVRLGAELNSVLGVPKNVKVLISETQVAFQSVPEGTSGSYEVRKGAIIYSTPLAERVIAIAKNIDFPADATTRCGHIEQTQGDENGNVTVILSFD